MLFCFLFDMRYQLGTSPPRGTVGCATFPFRFGFRLFVSPPRHDVACGRVSMLVSLVLAPVFSFTSPFFVSPPGHADGTWEGFDGGLSCHSAFLSRPPATLAVRGRFLTGGLPYYSVCVSFNYFSSRFSWHHSQAVQRCGSGF